MQGSRGVAAMAVAGRRNAHYRAYPPERTGQILCQALVGTRHTQFCWACAGKTQQKPPGNSCTEHLLICLSLLSVKGLQSLRQECG